MRRLLFFTLLLLAGLFLACISPAQDRKSVHWAQVDGVINPAVAEYLVKAVDNAVEDKAEALVIEMDTPGGLDPSMRTIVKRILSAEIPVVVYVHPTGARAASAGVFILYASHVAAMSPGTNMGAAHPVSMGKEMDETMSAKVTNDSVAYIKSIAVKRGRNVGWAEDAVRKSVSITADEAVKLGVVDLVAETRYELLEKIDGREVEVLSGKIVLHTKGAEIAERPMGLRQKILDRISDPNIAYILMMIGIYGIFFELSNPGLIFPGVVGGICLLLAFFAFQTLPVNYAGVALIILGVIFFIAEIMVISYGLLALGGVVAITLGSLMLFESPEPWLRISWQVLLPSLVGTLLFFGTLVYLAVRGQMRKPVSGKEGMIGERGVARTDLAPSGQVFIHGEIWQAEAETGEVHAGDAVEITGIQGLHLKVKKV